jgi:hypothetical protein
MMCGVTAEPRDFARHRRRRDTTPWAYANHQHAPGEFGPVGRGEAIQALSREVLIRRSLDISPSGFITIISIIQGVALGLLAQNTFPKPTVLGGIQSVTLLLVFVSVFYYYLTMSVLLRWAPSFLDCFLPFVIASLEIPPAFFLGNSVAWNAWLAGFWFLTMGGLMITTKWSPASHFGTVRKAHRLLHDLLRELRFTAGIGGFVVAFCALCAHLIPWQREAWGIVGAGTVLAMVAMIVARTELRASQIHALYGVNRPPFN